MILDQLEAESKKYIIATITIACISLIYYFHVVLKIEVIFTHLFYIPIFLAAFWWKRKGLLMPLSLALLLLISHMFFLGGTIINDFLRGLMFMFVGMISVVLSERIEKQEKQEKLLMQYTVDLERANEEVKQFAYIISHDMRAPLINVKGFVAELCSASDAVRSTMKDALPCLSEKQQKDVTIAITEDMPEAMNFIDSSVTRMDHLINALLKLSRLGYRELQFEAVDMAKIARSMLKGLAYHIDRDNIKVVVEAMPEIRADRMAMEQIMGNLLTNAVHYLDPDRPGEIEITSRREGSAVIFHVRDNGRGISKEDRGKIFMPFRRCGRQDVPGEGMGLSYVQAMVRRHGGHIGFESEEGRGTTFTFTIPNIIGDSHQLKK